MDEQEYSKAVDHLARILERLKPFSEELAKRKLLRDTTPLPVDLQNALNELNYAVDRVNRLVKEASPEQRERLSIPETRFTAKYDTTFSAN